jgi:hypothetical protein
MSKLMSRALMLAVLPWLASCTGPQTSGSSSSANTPYVASGLFTLLPSGRENPDQVFLAADTAYQQGRFVEAQRDFGTLYILQPAYANGAPAQALTQTCGFVPNDCGLLFDRLHLLRDAYNNLFGPPQQWPPQQSADFGAILACYEAALVRDWPRAVQYAGAIAAQSPLPAFQDYARRCVQPAQAQMDAANQQQVIDQAFMQWDTSYDCMESNRQLLMSAWSTQNWEQFVTVLPDYQACAAPLTSIIDSGVLANHPVLGDEHDVAFSNMSEVDLIVYDNQATVDQTRSAMAALQQNPDYANGLLELDVLNQEETRLRTEMQPLETALTALTGSARTPLEQRLALSQSQLQVVTTRRVQVVDMLNAIRASAGLGTLAGP